MIIQLCRFFGGSAARVYDCHEPKPRATRSSLLLLITKQAHLDSATRGDLCLPRRGFAGRCFATFPISRTLTSRRPPCLSVCSRYLGTIVLTALLAFSARAQEIEKLIADAEITGLAIAVIVDGEIDQILTALDTALRAA